MKLVMCASKVIAATAVLFSTTAIASDWKFTWIGSDDSRYFFDAETVEKTGNVVILWVKTVQTRKPETDGSWSSALRWKINCTKRTIQSLGFSIYDQDGKFIRSSNVIGQENPVVPDSTGEGMMKLACEAGFPHDKTNEKYFSIYNNDVYLATKNWLAAQKSAVDSAPK